MRETLDAFHRQLGRATVLVMWVSLGSLGLALLAAMFGLPHAVVTFNQVTLVLAGVFGVMLVLFLVTSLIAALVRFLDSRRASVS